MVVERPPPSAPGLRRLWQWIGYKMAVKTLLLDEVGSLAWRRLDGRTTVGEVARELRAEFGDRVEPVEERLGHLVRLLHRERLVAYPGWDGGSTPPR